MSNTKEKKSITILCTSDYHRSELVAKRIPEICKKEKVDLLVNTGDFQSHAYAVEFLEQANKLKIPTFADFSGFCAFGNNGSSWA